MLLPAVLILALPFLSATTTVLGSALPSIKPVPVPVVIWHGLGDRFDAPGLLSLKADIESRKELEGIFVHIVQIGEDGAGDQRATFFGQANEQVSTVCQQLLDLPEITSPKLNPSGEFDAIGFSQGGQLLRAVVEKCGGGGKRGLSVRNLITVGSQHMGISALPPCPAGSSPFSACRLMHLSLVREGLYSSFAQHNILPAQYFRDEARIDDYLRVNQFLKDINNEREGDEQAGGPPEEGTETRALMGEDEDEPEPRNQTYKDNFSSLQNLVLLRFSLDTTVVPPHSSHFTLPSPNATNCPLPPLPADPLCYATPLPFDSLPLYSHDYIGLRKLDKRGAIIKGVCQGEHMQIDEECWEGVVSWLGEGEGRIPKKETSFSPQRAGRLCTPTLPHTMFALLTSPRRRLLIFLSLSTTRALTVISLLLCFVAEFMTLASNLHHRALDRRGAAGVEGRYFEDTDIPLQSGGTVGFALAHLLTALFLLAAAIAETPLPAPAHLHMQQVWDLVFKPFGEDCGVLVPGVSMLWIASFELARNITGFVRVAIWMLFVLAIINIILGVTLRSSIKYLRSYTYVKEVDEEEQEAGFRPSSAIFDLPPPAVARTRRSSPTPVDRSLPSSSPLPFLFHRLTTRFRPSPSPPSTKSESLYSTEPPRPAQAAPPRPARPEMMVQIQSPSPVSPLSSEERCRLGPMERMG
ncbi:Alpha/Beta hydrolase protein [Leucosporidium creatinivorum]|uniref:Alpha/Beta hydrolase protein n=1 Tax=Leucosporidium creatinivorum TaxID=106004 RepID=A0A1Y2DKV7_9BASI|nr:Alpha/Beta hydrolase protein [Leucosporidium creatinivorum]